VVCAGQCASLRAGPNLCS